ncbi:MAG: hypothetical protein QOG95_3950 [Mycobacterium sp.]|nr:hypothetical protein [Mycobacterium sp.]
MDLTGQGFDRSGLSCRADAPTCRPYSPDRNHPARSDAPEAAGVGSRGFAQLPFHLSASPGLSAGAIVNSQVRIGAVGSVEGLFNSA